MASATLFLYAVRELEGRIGYTRREVWQGTQKERPFLSKRP